MNAEVKCPSCGKDVEPMAVGNKNFCPECEAEILAAVPAPAGSGHSIGDGMGMIEENRTKIGAVETFSDNSVTNHNHTTNTTNISNITKIEDDTKRSVVCEISGRKVLVTSSVVCPVCGKTVAEQYYDEAKLRCAACEKKARDAYEAFYKEMVTGARVIDAELRSVLDAKAAALKLTAEQLKEIEIKLRRTASDKQARLTDIQQKDFDRSIKQLKESRINAETCLNKVAAYARLTEDDSVQCWYRLLSALVSPENYLKDLNLATVDDFWQTYWGFVAAFKSKNTTDAVLCVDAAKSKYPDHINDVTLAQAYMEYLQYMDTKDGAYLSDAGNDVNCSVEMESRCLQEFRERLKAVLMSKDTTPTDMDELLLSCPVLEPASRPVRQSSASKPDPHAPVTKTVQQTPVSKGYTLNSAGGPLNPTVTSFTQVSESRPKKKSAGLWVALAAVVALAGLYFTMGGGSEAEQPVEDIQEVVTEQKAVTPPVKVETPVKEETPVRNQTPPAKPSMAEKAASGAAAEAGPQADALKQGLEAYEKGDYKLAHDLFKKAGTAGNAEACYQLGLMLSTGKGTVAKNPLQGKVWIRKAAGLGHAEAAKSLETL